MQIVLNVSNYIEQDNFFIEYREDTTGEVFSVWVKSGVSEVSFRRGSTYGSYETKNSVLCSAEKIVFDDFYTNLQDDTYAMTGTAATFQMAVALAIGKVRDKFKKMRKNASNIVVFVNTMDVYTYLGGAEISIQSQFGIIP